MKKRKTNPQPKERARKAAKALHRATLNFSLSELRSIKTKARKLEGIAKELRSIALADKTLMKVKKSRRGKR